MGGLRAPAAPPALPPALPRPRHRPCLRVATVAPPRAGSVGWAAPVPPASCRRSPAGPRGRTVPYKPQTLGTLGEAGSLSDVIKAGTLSNRGCSLARHEHEGDSPGCAPLRVPPSPTGM